MNRKEFVKDAIVVEGAAVLSHHAFATEREKKLKTAVVYLSWNENTRFAAPLLIQ